MPIITTLSIARSPAAKSRRARSACSACQSWATISPVVRLRLNPWWPVEQKRHPTAHPACDDTHSVPRSCSGMNTVSIALPAPTSNSHFTVPSPEACSETTVSGTIVACSASLSRSDLARSLICANSRAPFWWIQRNSWVARNRFSPKPSQKAASPSRSKSRRLAATPALSRIDRHGGEEETNLHRGRLWRVGPVHRIRIDAVGEVGADGALLGLLRVGGTHQFAVLHDRALAFEDLDHHRARDHEVDQVI